MYDLAQHEDSHSRCLFTCTKASSDVDLGNPPTKKAPFSNISRQPLTHTLELLIPKAATQALRQALSGGAGTLHYAKVHMKLLEVVSGDFFNQYIKSGNIVMLSSGRAGIDPIFSLSQGILRLEVDRPTYERLGLEGKPMAHEGRKHVKARYAVEINLRLPSMVRGKRGFERVVRAFENVLVHSVTWLFCDLNATTDGSGAIAAHQPVVRCVDARVEECEGVKVPNLPTDLGPEDFVEAGEMLEWLTLVLSGSPRVLAADNVDPVLSRYRTPEWLGCAADTTQSSVQDLVAMRWQGLITPAFTLKIFLAALKVCTARWMAMNVSHFNGSACALLYTEKHHLVWEYKN